MDMCVYHFLLRRDKFSALDYIFLYESLAYNLPLIDFERKNHEFLKRVVRVV